METKKLNTAFDLFSAQLIGDKEFLGRLEEANPQIEFRIVPGGRKWTPEQVIVALNSHTLSPVRIELVNQISQYGKDN